MTQPVGHRFAKAIRGHLRAAIGYLRAAMSSRTDFMMRDIQARMKAVAIQRKKSEEAPKPALGLFARSRGVLGLMKRKGALHV